MATLDPVAVGTTPDDGLGDPLRTAFIKINSNEDIINTDVGLRQIAPLNRVVVNSAADFPTVVGGKIPLVANTEYYIGSNTVTVADEFTVAPNVSFIGAGAPALVTYTGTGNMFEGDGIGLFAIKQIAVDLPNGGHVFGITDTVQSSVINMLDYRVLSCGSLGTITGVLAFVMEFGSIFAMDNGITLVGNIAVISVDKMFGFSTSATHKTVDLGSAVASTLEFSDMAITAPIGAFGISGLASSGNLPVGSIATVVSCEFLGGMTTLENITTDDIRWSFLGNSGIPNSNPDALLSLNGNATETVIALVDTPVKVAGTWVIERVSQMTGTTDGRVTFNAERTLASPITIQVTISSASGTNKEVHMHLALNGSIIANALSVNKVGQNDPRTLNIPWQLNLSENDYIEIFVENKTDAVNLIVSQAIVRVR